MVATCSARCPFRPSSAPAMATTRSSKTRLTDSLEPDPHGPSALRTTSLKGMPLGPPRALAWSTASLAAVMTAVWWLSGIIRPMGMKPGSRPSSGSLERSVCACRDRANPRAAAYSRILIKGLDYGSLKIFLPTASATFRRSSTSIPNSSGNSDWEPSQRASSGR